MSSTQRNVAFPVVASLTELPEVVVIVIFSGVPLTFIGNAVFTVPGVKLTLRPIIVFVTVAGVIPKRVAASELPETVVGTEN